MSDPVFPPLFGASGSNAAFYASGLTFGATTLILLCTVVARAKVEARVSATAARPWLRFLQLLTLAAALRCAWCFMTAADIGGSGGSKCLTGSACSVPIFITALNRLSMLIYFAAFAIFSGQIMRIGMAPRLQQHKASDEREPSSADASGAPRTFCGCRRATKRDDAPGKRADSSINDTGVLGAGTGRSASAASKVVARTDCCLTLLAVWMLVVQLLFLAISVALELPYISAENMYNGYICMVAILNLVLFGVIVFGLRKADDLMAGMQGYHSDEAARLRMDLALQRALASGLDGSAAAVAAADELSRGRCWCGRQQRLQAAMALAGARVARHASSAGASNGDDDQSDDEDAGLFAAAARFGAGTVVAAANTVGKTGVAGVKLLGWATGLGPRSSASPTATMNSALFAAGSTAGRWNAAGGIAPAPPAPDAAAALAAWQLRAGVLAVDPMDASGAAVDQSALLEAPPQMSTAALSAVLRSQPATSLLAAAQMPADSAAARAVASKLEAQLEAMYPLLAVGDRDLDRTLAYVPAYTPAVAPVVLASSRPAPSAGAPNSMRQPLLASDSLGLAPSSGYSFDELEPHASSRPVSLSRGASSSLLAVTRTGHEEGIPLAEALAALRAVHAANGIAPADASVPASPQRSRSRGRDETRRDTRASSSSRSRSQGRRRDASAERYRLLHGIAGDSVDTSLLNRSGEIDTDEEAASSLQLAAIGPSRAGSSTALTADAAGRGGGASTAHRPLPTMPAPQPHAFGSFSPPPPPAFASPSLRDASLAAGPSDRLPPTDAEKRTGALRSLSLQLRVRQHDAASRLLFGWRLELLLLCAVTGILFGLKAVMFLWRPVSGTSIGGLAGVILYPFFFYTVPECVPALLCALAAAGLPMHVVARAVFGGPLRLIRYLLCCRCCCARQPSPEEARAAAAAVDILSSKASWASGLKDPTGVLSCTEPAILAAFGAAAEQPTAASAKAFLSSLAAQAGISTAAIPTSALSSALTKRDPRKGAGVALLPASAAYDADAGAW